LFEWNVDSKYGNHFHITPDGKNRFIHPETGDTKKLDLHDSRIGKIRCNYDTHEAYIPLELDSINKKMYLHR